MTTADIEKIEGQINSWWDAAIWNNQNVNIPPDDTLSIGNRSIDYKTFKKLMDKEILSKTELSEDIALMFNFNKNSINAIANSLLKADESRKYDISLCGLRHYDHIYDPEKTKEELWLPILDLIEGQKNDKDNTMHIILNRNTSYDDADEEINANKLSHISFSIVCGGRCFLFEPTGSSYLAKHDKILSEDEQISNKLKGNLSGVDCGIQHNAFDCNSITLGTMKNFIKSFTKDFGSDPELFSEYLSLFFSKDNRYYPTFSSEEAVYTKKPRDESIYTGILPKEFFKYVQTVYGMNKIKEEIAKKLEGTGMDGIRIEGKKREFLIKLSEKIDSINRKYIKSTLSSAGYAYYSNNTFYKDQNTRAKFERIKLLLDLGDLENKGELDIRALPTLKKLVQLSNEKAELTKTSNLSIEGSIELAQAGSNPAGGRKTFQDREAERKKEKDRGLE
jgi:hypothetical protein